MGLTFDLTRLRRPAALIRPRAGRGLAGLRSRAALESLFALLHTVTSRENRRYRYPSPDEDVLRPYRDAMPFPLDSRGNDGIVPTFSQIYGRVIDVVVADHLDVVGQFVRDDLPHADWLPSGSDFDWARFENVWGGVAREIAEAGSSKQGLASRSC